MISVKSSTNLESLKEFGRSRRIDWRNPMDTPGLPNPNFQNQEFCAKKPGVDQEILV
jgi:hypothetical protein